jgi:hypothetical protein
LLLLPSSQTHAAAVLGVHGGETDMGIYCTFQLSGGDRTSDPADYPKKELLIQLVVMLI